MKSLKEEFLEILTNYQGILHKVSFVYCKNKTDREDNIQEIIYQLWKSFPTINNHSSIGSWIYAVSINTSLSRIKKESRVEYRETIPEISDKSDLIENLSMNESLKLLLNAILTLISLISGLLSWYKIRNNKFSLSLKDWLNERIILLSTWLTGKFSKLYLFVIPILYVLTVLLIHVYFENKSFIDVLNTEESVIGLIVGTPIGLFVSFFAVRKIRRYQLQNLNFLKDMYGRLCNES